MFFFLLFLCCCCWCAHLCTSCCRYCWSHSTCCCLHSSHCHFSCLCLQLSSFLSCSQCSPSAAAICCVSKQLGEVNFLSHAKSISVWHRNIFQNYRVLYFFCKKVCIFTVKSHKMGNQYKCNNFGKSRTPQLPTIIKILIGLS